MSRKIDVDDYFEETVLELQKFTGFFVTSADWNFVVIIDIITINSLDLCDLLLGDTVSQHEKPDHGSLS